MVCFRPLALGSIAILAMTSAADAALIQGSDSISIISVSTTPSTDLLTTVANGGTIKFGTIFWGSGGGGMANIPSDTPISDSSLKLTPAGLNSFTLISSYGTFAGSSSLTVGNTTYLPKLTGKSGSPAAGTETVGLYLVGIFTPAGPISSLAPNSMSMALTLSENGITAKSPVGSFSASLTVAAPASGPGNVGTGVPEPMTIALLGSGLLGLGLIRRTRT